MKFRAKVTEVTETNVPAFGPHPTDPRNTIHLGNTQRVILSVVHEPEVMGNCGVGLFNWTLPPSMMGQFKPDEVVTIEITKEGK